MLRGGRPWLAAKQKGKTHHGEAQGNPDGRERGFLSERESEYESDVYELD